MEYVLKYDKFFKHVINSFLCIYEVCFRDDIKSVRDDLLRC